MTLCSQEAVCTSWFVTYNRGVFGFWGDLLQQGYTQTVNHVWSPEEGGGGRSCVTLIPRFNMMEKQKHSSLCRILHFRISVCCTNICLSVPSLLCRCNPVTDLVSSGVEGSLSEFQLVNNWRRYRRCVISAWCGRLLSCTARMFYSCYSSNFHNTRWKDTKGREETHRQ